MKFHEVIFHVRGAPVILEVATDDFEDEPQPPATPDAQPPPDEGDGESAPPDWTPAA